MTQPATPPFEVQDYPGRGRGLRATRGIARGECICEEYAICGAFHMTRSSSTDLESLAQRLNGRNIDRKNRLRQLMNKNGQTGDNAALDAVFEKNAFCTDAPRRPASAKAVSAVFPNLCLANHSCLPNAVVDITGKVDPDLYHGKLFAACDIPKNTEITVSYCEDPDWDSTSQRQAPLQSRYGFLCECIVCQENPTSHHSSRANTRVMLKELHQSLQSNEGSEDVYGQRHTASEYVGEMESELGGKAGGNLASGKLDLPYILDPRLADA